LLASLVIQAQARWQNLNSKESQSRAVVGAIKNRTIDQKFVVLIKKLSASQTRAHARLGSQILSVSGHSRPDGQIHARRRGLDRRAGQ
jgi:hypothetical protein